MDSNPSPTISVPPRPRPSMRCALSAAAVAVIATPVCAATDLTSLSLEALLNVTITGASKYEQTQREVAAAVHVITRQEIKAFGWRTIGEALTSVPGVYTTFDDQYVYLGTRGFGLPGDYNTRLLMTIDGNRQNDPLYDGAAFGRGFPLDVDLIERIEFIPGPGGAVYGQNAMFGVVNIVTRTGSNVGGVEAAGSYQHPQAGRQGRLSWGGKLHNGVDVLLSASAYEAKGKDRFFEYGSAGISGMATDMDGQHDKEFFARLERGPWLFDLESGYHIKDDPTGAFFSDPLVPGQYQGDSYILSQLQYSRSLADDTLHVSGRLFMGQSRYRSQLSYSGWYAYPAGAVWRGTEWRMVSTALAHHKLMLGVEAQDNVQQDQAALDLSDPASDIHILNSGYRVGLYAQDEWRVADTVTATLGARIDRDDVTGTKTSPRAGLIWQAGAGTTLKALYGRAFRSPNAYEREYDDGAAQVANPALSGETIDTFEVVADRRLSDDLAVRGSVYRWIMRDIVVLGLDSVSGLPQYQSGEDVTASGMELSADKTWRAGSRLRGSVSFHDVTYASGADLLNSPKLLGRLNLSGPLLVAGLRAGYEALYDSQRMTQDGSKLGGYVLSNLTVSTGALAKGLELSVGIYNMFDKQYSQPGSDTNWQNALVQPGRTVRMMLTYAL